MKEIKIPGVLWVAIVVLLIYAIDRFFPEMQPYSEFIIMAGAALLKLLDVGVDDTDELIDIVNRLENEMQKEESTQEGGEQVRKISDHVTHDQRLVMSELKKPSKTKKWLLG